MRRAMLLMPLLAGVAVDGQPAGASGPDPPGQVFALLLPARGGERDQYEAKVREVGALVAERTGLGLASAARAATDLSRSFEQALESYARGDVDAAAAMYDVALEMSFERPARVRSDLLVTAAITRAAIALARAEGDTARRLVRRLLEYDEDFTLRVDELRPSLRQLVRDQRSRPPAGRGWSAAAGRSCEDAAILLLGRRRSSRRLQIARVERCRVTHEVIAQVDQDAADIARLLGFELQVETARPWVRRPAFWIAAGAAASVAAGAILFLLPKRDSRFVVRVHP